MDSELRRQLRQLSRQGRLRLERGLTQHGSTSVLAHSVRVAAASLALVDWLGLRVDRRALVRGALLHDYFLYDWHRRQHRLHGFTHPAAALQNARADYPLTHREENIIARHMFPLVPIPPTCREAWLVCAADKYCALAETLQPCLPRGAGKGRADR